MSELSDIALTQLRNVIAERLRAAILANEIKPGEWLRQEQLAQKFGVSQTPVREALQDLVGEGIVERVPYRGIRVIEFNTDDLIDLYQVRAFMEGLAAGYAAMNCTPEEIAKLTSTMGKMEHQRAQKNWDEYRQLNRQFHQTIYTASHHTYLIRTLNLMWTAFPTMMLGNFAQTASRPIPQRRVSDRQEHERIIAALEKHDAQQAQQLMQQHIEESAKRIIAVLRTDPVT